MERRSCGVRNRDWSNALKDGDKNIDRHQKLEKVRKWIFS